MATNKINGAELICLLLKRHNVQYVFGLFGDIQTDFAHALSKSPLKWIGVHNEKSGGFMADIYARVSKKPGVVFTTLGPGVTNLTSALANATQDRVPLVAISDQVNRDEDNLDTHQFIDTAKLFHPSTGVSKFAAKVNDIKELPSIFEKAFSIANAEPQGAVHIAVPADIFAQKISERWIKSKLVAKKIKQNKAKSNLNLENKLKNLINNKQALVIAGGGIERAGVEAIFQQFIENYSLPVLTTFRGKNAIESSHPQNLGTISRHMGDALGEIMQRVSYVLLIGYDYTEGLDSLLINSDKVINLTSYDNRIKNKFNPTTHIIDFRNLLANLVKEKATLSYPKFDFSYYKKNISDLILSSFVVKNKYFDPLRIIDAINTIFTKDTVIVCDVGLNKYYSGLFLDAKNNKKIYFSNGMSSMAFTAGTLGAKIANPKSSVIALVGDGGFLMDIQEVLTSVQTGLPVIWIVFNNGGLGLVEQAQIKNNGIHHGVKFEKILFSHLAKAFGVYGKYVRSGEELKRTLGFLKKSKRSAIIDVPVKYAE